MEQLNYNTQEINSQSTYKYKHLSYAERIKIERLYNENKSPTEIGKRICRDKNVILKEIRQYGKMNQPSSSAIRAGQKEYRYYANAAQNARNEKYKRPRFQKKFEPFLKYFKKNFKSHNTLEEILMDFKKNMNPLPAPSLKTLYNWAHKGLLRFSWGAKIVKPILKRGSRKIQIEGRKSIKQRKDDFGFEMNDYSDAGHYEIDTIYNGDKKGGVLTFNHRQTMRLYAEKIPDRKATTINKALRKIIAIIGAHNILSITSDNGSEFAYSAVIENCYDLKWYYCSPYSSWQRGQNERLNRDIRRFYPKKTIITRISDHKFDKVIQEINSKPRRAFDGLNAIEYSLLQNKPERINFKKKETK